MGKRSDAFGKALDNWLDEVVKVYAEKDGFAWGRHSRVRAKFSTFKTLRSSQEDEKGLGLPFK